MFENIDIEKVKEELRNHSKNYKENFAKIEKFIETKHTPLLQNRFPVGSGPSSNICP